MISPREVKRLPTGTRRVSDRLPGKPIGGGRNAAPDVIVDDGSITLTDNRRIKSS